MEVVYTILAFNRESPCLVRSRPQASLHRLTQFDVFALDEVAKRKVFGELLGYIGAIHVA
jgi:hypothetical protein